MLDGSVKILSDCMDRMTKVNRYIIRGWHSSVLTPDYYGGGLLGYAEPEWQDRLILWLRKQLDWVSRTGARRLIDLYPNDLELIAQYYPDDIRRFKEAIKDGRLEAVNGIYSAAWLPILSEESNVRHFSYGLKGYRDVLDAQVKTFICAADHIDFHPQLPQILKNFDYSSAILKNSSRIDSEIIRWRGLDGTELDAVQRINFRWASPEAVLAADQRGHKSVVLGTPAFDAGTDLTSERESTPDRSYRPGLRHLGQCEGIVRARSQAGTGRLHGRGRTVCLQSGDVVRLGLHERIVRLEPGLGEPVARGRETHGDCSGYREGLPRFLARIAGGTPYSMEEPAPFPRPHALWTG